MSHPLQVGCWDMRVILRMSVALLFSGKNTLLRIWFFCFLNITRISCLSSLNSSIHLSEKWFCFGICDTSTCSLVLIPNRRRHFSCVKKWTVFQIFKCLLTWPLFLRSACGCFNMKLAAIHSWSSSIKLIFYCYRYYLSHICCRLFCFQIKNRGMAGRQASIFQPRQQRHPKTIKLKDLTV